MLFARLLGFLFHLNFLSSSFVKGHLVINTSKLPLKNLDVFTYAVLWTFIMLFIDQPYKNSVGVSRKSHANETSNQRKSTNRKKNTTEWNFVNLNFKKSCRQSSLNFFQTHLALQFHSNLLSVLQTACYPIFSVK